jgi:hypothetical protein
MAALSADAVAGYAYGAGFRGDALATIVAVTAIESMVNGIPWNTDAVGDQNRAGERAPGGRTWGPSIGLGQVRSIVEESGSGRTRDATRLPDPAFNLRSCYRISAGGSTFRPWSVFKSGAHRRYLDEARAAANAVTARGGNPGGSSGMAVATGPAGSLGTSGDINPLTRRLPESTSALQRIEGFQVAGRAIDGGDLQALAISARVSLSVEQVSQITLTFADPRGTVQVWEQFREDAEVNWFDLRLRVAATEWGELDGAETLTATLRAAGAQAMRTLDPAGTSRSWTNMSPTEVLAERAKAAGMRFYGKGTARRATITRHGRDDAGGAQAESDWDMGQRLAREEGFWLFETTDALYFAPPSWLTERGTTFLTRWRASVAEQAYETIGVPQAKRSVDTDRVAGIPIAEITAQLPPWRGYLVRPGMNTDFAGIPAFEMKYLVVGVDFDLDGGIAPVQVQLTQPVDPVPDPPEQPAGTAVDDLTGAGAIGGGQGSTGTATGPYGYQYDPAGGSCLGREEPGTRALLNHLVRKFGVADWGIYDCRKIAGTRRVSVHSEGRAGDVGVPVLSGSVGDRVANYLVRNAPLFGIQQVIWDRHDWNSHTRIWTTYSHPGGSNVTLDHRDHIHFEQCRQAARTLTPAMIAGAT